MKRTSILFALFLGLFACGEEESSTCEVDGPCEQFMMARCECCANGDLVDGGNDQVVEACQQDKRLACETGRLTISLSPETCQSNLDAIAQYREAGMDFCADMEREQLESHCYEAASPQSMSEEI